MSLDKRKAVKGMRKGRKEARKEKGNKQAGNGRKGEKGNETEIFKQNKMKKGKVLACRNF